LKVFTAVVTIQYVDVKKNPIEQDRYMQKIARIMVGNNIYEGGG